MGEVTPGPPLPQLSSAPGEAACSLLGALTGAEGAGGDAGTPALMDDTLFVGGEAVCCSVLRLWLLESFLSASAGTGMMKLSCEKWVRVL